MADYTSGSINFAGLGNGTDFNSLIDGMVEVEMNRVRRLESWKSSWETKDTQFQLLNTQMLTSKTTLESFDTMNEFMTKAVTSNDTTLLTASADSDAQEASHTIEIGQLASNDVHITASGTSDLTTSVTSTETFFTYSYGGDSYTLSNISAGTTLEGFVNIINNHADSRDNIRASTIYDGSVYHLQLTGLDQGSDNQVIISNAGDLIFGASDFNETQDAVDSQIRVNGFPSSSGGWIERSSNTIDDVIEGITLNLNDAEEGTDVTLTVVTDTDAVKSNIQSFVDSINIIRTQIKAITSVDEDGKGSILTGNYGIDIISSKIRNLTADMGIGFQNYDSDDLTGDKYSALSQLGILTDAEEGSLTYGLLKIDYDALDDALDEDPAGVAELFSANYLGESQSTDFTFSSLVDGTTAAGIYDIEIVSDGTEITSATINGVAASISGWEITAASGDALGMAIRLDNTSAGTYTGDVTVKLGKIVEMSKELEALTEPFNEHTYEGGPLAVLQDNYGEIMDNIDKKIEYETNRIDKMETAMRLKFARLDALLGQYELKQGQLDSSIMQLS